MQLKSLSALIASLAACLVVIAAHAEPLYQTNLCCQGYVWREAFPGDDVCVTPATRTQAAYDNSRANARRDPGGAYGPYTCIQGYVWRAARPDDLVCVTPATRSQAAYDNSREAARVAKVFNQPRWHGDRLDWCWSLGTGCGKQVASAFCQRKRYEQVDGFRGEFVGGSAQTRTMGTDEVCDGSDCWGFAHISCTAKFSDDRVFTNPEWNGKRLDVCLQWGTNCGKPAADAYCRTRGFSESLVAFQDAEPGYAATSLIGTDQICNASYCRGFQQIICK